MENIELVWNMPGDERNGRPGGCCKGYLACAMGGEVLLGLIFGVLNLTKGM